MRGTSLILFILFLAGACSGAQVIMSGSGSRDKDHVYFRYETRIEPELPGQKISGFGGGLLVGDRFHRYMTDTARKKYFGYDLSILPEGPGVFRVAFEPLSVSAEKLGLRPAGEWSAIPTPRLPSPRIVRGGREQEVLVLDLFTHPETRQKIFDLLIIRDTPLPGARLPSGPPRDYTVEDVPLTISKLRLSVNGKQVEQWGGSMSGEAVAFYLPNHGRFVFSLAPHADLGFRKAGEVRGATLKITWGNDTYVFECDGPIAPGGGVFNLYVYHDPSWRPRGGPDAFHLASSSPVSTLVRR
jgi:hypothetical protein